MDIFLSSTSKDLGDCRAKVRDIIDRMRQVSVAMETFGAQPDTPLRTCRQKVEASDALIVVVGHRYGWVPTKKQGGDGYRSITWWEVQWALDAKKPVFAFIIAPQAPWTGEREQDRLLGTKSEKQVLDVGRAVQGLQKFREFLDKNTTHELFSNADNLSARVASSLHPWLLNHAVKAAGLGVPPPTGEKIHISGVSKPRSRWLDRKALYYGYEQVHLQSARALVSNKKHIRLGLIAGRADTSHPAFVGARITQINISGREGAREADDYTTGVASLLAGLDDDGYEGVVPGAELLVLGVVDKNYLSDFHAINRAINAARIEGVQVLYIALSGSQGEKEMRQAVQAATDAGTIVVCGAGNLGSFQPQYPAAFPEVISAGAITPTGELADFSSYGDWVDVYAPGVGIPVAAGSKGYTTSDGTSVSGAITAGVVALMVGANQHLSPRAAKQILQKSSTPSRANVKIGGGLLNAYRAVDSVSIAGSHKSRGANRKSQHDGKL